MLERVEGLAEKTASPERQLDVATVYRRHGAEVSRWVKRLWGRNDAEDVLHEVFLVVQRRLGEFRHQSSLKTWLYAITIRVVSYRRRKERLRRLLFLQVVPAFEVQQVPVETPFGGAVKLQASRIVYAILDELSERDRTLLILFEIEGLPIAQIMEVLSISEDNAWVSLHRARARFRKVYVKRFGREQEL